MVCTIPSRSNKQCRQPIKVSFYKNYVLLKCYLSSIEICFCSFQFFIIYRGSFISIRLNIYGLHLLLLSVLYLKFNFLGPRNSQNMTLFEISLSLAVIIYACSFRGVWPFIVINILAYMSSLLIIFQPLKLTGYWSNN